MAYVSKFANWNPGQPAGQPKQAAAPSTGYTSKFSNVDLGYTGKQTLAEEVTRTLQDTKATDTQKYSVLKKARKEGLIDQNQQLDLIKKIGEAQNELVKQDFMNSLNPFEKAAIRIGGVVGGAANAVKDIAVGGANFVGETVKGVGGLIDTQAQMDKQNEYNKKKQKHLKQFLGNEGKYLEEAKKYDKANKDKQGKVNEAFALQKRNSEAFDKAGQQFYSGAQYIPGVSLGVEGFGTVAAAIQGDNGDINKRLIKLTQGKDWDKLSDEEKKAALTQRNIAGALSTLDLMGGTGKMLGVGLKTGFKEGAKVGLKSAGKAYDESIAKKTLKEVAGVGVKELTKQATKSTTTNTIVGAGLGAALAAVQGGDVTESAWEGARHGAAGGFIGSPLDVSTGKSMLSKINPTKLEVALKDAEVKPPKVTKIEVKTSKAEVKKPVSAPVEPKQIKTRTIRTADGKTEYVAQIGNSVTDRVGRETGFKASSTSPNFSSEGEMNKWIKKQTDASTPQPTAPKVEAPQVGKTVTLDKDVTLYHGSRDKIDTFDLNHLNATYMHDGLGINFTDSKDFAKLYSRGKNQWGEINKFDDGKGFINEKTIPKGTKVLDVSDKSRKVSDILSIDDFKSLAKKGRDKEFARENLERNARNILTGRDDSSLVIAKKVSSMSDDELLDVAYNRLKDRTFANGEGLPDVFRQLIDVYGIKTDDIADVTRQFSKQTGIDVIKTKKADGSSVYTVLNPDKLNAKPTVVPQVTKTPVAETKPVAPTEGTAGRVYERMKAEHPEIYTDATSKESITLKQEADTAVSMIAQDKQKVFDIAMQAEASPEVTSTAANIALVDQALKEGNVELANRLTRARSIAQKRRGQEISAERLTTDNSRQRYMDELLSMKLNKYGERYLGDLETKVKKSTPSKRALAKLDSEVARMETRIKSKKLTVDDAIGLLEKMACI